ncbi:MAG: MarR family transcriptional regulator [Lentimicrobiaceae bacterium]|nr:MarR family transcriptional regulator [Lentimicrobiaceae bacterium]MDD4597086.1 MarR family transcriptional regulator [Lentimicrobiaceae bacterium]MDY0025087.1 MarR family transcriptional regulator [Lentimicrobium sp.]
MSLTIINGIITDFPDGFSKNHLIVIRLLDENGRMYITEIVDIVGITKPQMTATADKLIKMGLVTRENDNYDRRKIFLSLTPEGAQWVAKVNQNIDIIVDELLSDFTEKEIGELVLGLKAFNKISTICISRYNEKLKK